MNASPKHSVFLRHVLQPRNGDLGESFGKDHQLLATLVETLPITLAMWPANMAQNMEQYTGGQHTHNWGGEVPHGGAVLSGVQMWGWKIPFLGMLCTWFHSQIQ